MTADGVTLVAWHVPAKGNKPTILYFHGNGANAANRAPKSKRFVLAALASFTSIIVVMADPVVNPQKRTMSPMRLLRTITYLRLGNRQTK